MSGKLRLFLKQNIVDVYIFSFSLFLFIISLHSTIINSRETDLDNLINIICNLMSEAAFLTSYYLLFFRKKKNAFRIINAFTVSLYMMIMILFSSFYNPVCVAGLGVGALFYFFISLKK